MAEEAGITGDAMMTDHDRTAGTPASRAAADRQRHHSPGGVGPWFRSRPAPLAGFRCGLRGVLSALFAFLLLLGLSTGVQAQTEQVFISNIDQSGAAYNSSSNDHRAQAFTTGNEANGYTLTSVDVAYWGLGATSNLSVTIRSVNSGGNPGGTLGTLNNPAHSGLSGRGVLTHEAPGAGIALAANTTYFVVWAPFGGFSVGHSSVSSDAEDAGGASGWSIANGQKFGSNGTSWGDYGNSLQIRLNGTVTVTSSGGGVTVSPTSLALMERSATELDARKAYTVVLDTDPGVDVTVTATNGDSSAVTVDTDAVTSGLQSTLTFTAGGDGSGSGAGNGNWAVPQTVAVESRIDADVISESFSITHSATAASGPYSGITIDPVAVTVTDAGHGVVVSESSLSVGENDETATYTVELKSQPSGNVTVSATSGATATATVSPPSVTFTPADWDGELKMMTVTGKGAGTTSISHAITATADATNYPSTTTIPPVAVTVTAAPIARLTLSPAEIPSGSLDGATITLVPKNSTFVAAGGGGGAARASDFHPDDWDSENSRLKNPNGEARLSASGLAKITLSGAPSGLTIASGKLLARETSHSHGGATQGHRSAEITFAYSGSAITADDPVTVNVRGGSGQGLLRWGRQGDSSFPPNLSAGFTVKAAVVADGVTVSPTTLALTELGAANEAEKTYTVVLDTDPGADVTITVTNGDSTAVEVDTNAGTTGNQNTLTFTHGNSGNWSTAQTVTVRALNDADAAAESFNITHAATATGSTAPYHGITIDPVAVTTTDAGHGVVVSPSSLTVAENDQTATYSVVLKSQPSGNVVVSTTSGATATATVLPGTLTFGSSGVSAWNVARAVTVTGKGAGSTSISHAIQSSADTTNYPTTLTIPAVSVTVTAAANPRLTLSPTQIQAASLSGATITLVPNDATFFAAGGQGTEDGGEEGGRARTYVDSRDLVGGRIPNTAVRLSSTGLGLITLSGAPAGLTIASGRLLARQTGTQSTHGVDRHRSVEITLAYSGAAITADDPVTVNVNRDLLRSGVSDGPLGSDLSAGFTIKAAAAVPVLSVALPSVEGVTRNTAGQQVFAETGAGTDDPEVSFDVTLAPAPSADFAACIRVTETGGDRVAAGAEGVKAVTVPSTGSLVHTIQWTDTAADDRDSVVTVEAVAPGTAECPAASGTYTVSSTDASDSALVHDDDPTTVALTSSDTSMAEGDASNTATLTFTLGRQLHADEAVVVPFTLATTTGARLPGHATPDFAVTAAGAGVTIANANMATPSLTFTGHGTNTVRTATVTLTPVANRDDGDTAREEITATLAADSVLGSTAGSGTTVGGGAMRHGTDFAADLTLEDDEAPPGSVIFSVSRLRLLENGSAIYTVRLNQEPTALVSAGVTPIGGDRGAVTAVSTAFFWPGTGSQTSWNSLQTITVTGVDEPGTHRNRTTTIRYSLSSTDPAFNGRTFDLPVEIDDAPEVEAWEGWNRADGSAGDNATLFRPNTVVDTPGLWPRQDMAFGSRPLDYVIRLSNRPAPGGTVTVNVNRDNSDVQLALTRNGPWRSSLTVTFGDGFAAGAAAPNMRACNNSHDWTEGGEAHDATAATSWECWRKIWVRRVGENHNCTDLTHTASGGGIRSRTIETIRAHNPTSVRNNNYKNVCPFLTPNTEPAALNDPGIQVPAAQVANLEVTKVDANSASASWDAVAHATGYEVAWDALDGNGQSIAAGIHAGVTGTTETIEHNAPGAASLKVTVTPEHVDGNGDTQVSADLAATATLDLSTPQSAQADSVQATALSCDLASVKADVEDYILETQHGSAHVARWKKALAGLNREAGGMTAAGARQMKGKYSPGRWQPVVDALDCLEKAALPVVTVSAGNAVTEGDPATFTVTATPAPSSPLTVTLTVGQDGDHAASGQTGTRQVTVPTGGSATLSVATADDGADEPDGSVTATVEAGTGYTVGGAATASVAVADDDDPPAAQADSLQAGASSCDLVSVKADVEDYIGETQHGAAHVARWKKALAGLNRETGGMTAAGARQMKADFSPGRWQPVVEALDCLEAAATPQPETPAVVPELGLAAGDAVDEGGDATFTVHADPAPEADLTVAFTVAQSGDWLSAPEPASRTVTLAAGATSATLAIATADDEADEADGSVSVTLDAGTGYTIAAGRAAGTVAVRDNDEPVVSIAAGSGVTEGAPASFTVTATPAPHAALTVSLAVTQDGDFAAEGQTGAREVTIPVAGSVTVTVATADDGADEPDGSVSVTLDAGAGYTVAAGQAAGTVAVRDNDEPVISIAAGSGVTEGAPASFTLTANPAPHAALTVSLAVTQSGDYAASGQTGARQVTIPTGGSIAFEVATVNDTADEPDGSVTATLAAGSGYAVAASPDDAASVAVADDDVAAVPEGPSLSVNDVEVKEGPYRRVEFTVTLSEALEKYVSFYYRVRESSPVSAKRGVDFWASTQKNFAGMRPGQTEYRIRAAMVIDDSHDEDPETFEIVLSDANGAAIADGVGVATIVNDDPMPAAWLARFGRTVAEQALDGIAGRIAAPREAGAQGTLAGQALNFDPGSDGAANDNAATGSFSAAGGFGGLGNSGFGTPADGFGPFGFGAGSGHDAHLSDSGAPQSQSMTLGEALLGSSFTLTGAEDSSGGSMAFWGRAAQSSFDGREGTFSLDGETNTAMLGADYARGKWLVGLALMQSSGEGGYADTGIGTEPCPEDMDLCNGAVRTGDGKVEATLTAAVPYAALQASERLKLWGAAGHGTGEVTLKPETDGALKADVSWSMAAMGMRGDLLPPPSAGPALALTTDALWARTSSEKTHELAASDSDVTRLRVGLEGSYAIATEGDGHLTPRLEIGARHDGGDAETGFGMELGGGIAWVDPAMGLSLDLSGRTLIAHGDDDLEDRGFAASMVFDPDPGTERGLSLTLRQDWGGSAQGGLDALFATDPLADRTGFGEAESRWQAEAAYGLPAFSGAFTGSPHVGLGLATGSRDYTLGWRLSPAANANAPDLSFGVKATRHESDGAEPVHTTGLEGVLRW